MAYNLEHLRRVGFQKGGDSRRSNGRPFQKGHKINVGKKRKFTEIHKQNISKSKIGYSPWNKGKHMTEEQKIKLTLMRRKGKSMDVLNIRRLREYKIWRQSVFERDNFTCIWCGQRGGKLEADHIKPFALFPELRLAIDNGRTLCKECHKKTDTYFYKLKKFIFIEKYNQVKHE